MTLRALDKIEWSAGIFGVRWGQADKLFSHKAILIDSMPFFDFFRLLVKPFKKFVTFYTEKQNKPFIE